MRNVQTGDLGKWKGSKKSLHSLYGLINRENVETISLFRQPK